MTASPDMGILTRTVAPLEALPGVFVAESGLGWHESLGLGGLFALATEKRDRIPQGIACRAPTHGQNAPERENYPSASSAPGAREDTRGKIMSERTSSCSCVRSGRAVIASGNAMTKTRQRPLRVNGARLTEQILARPMLSGPRARSYGAEGADTRLATGQSGEDQVGRTSLRPSAPVKKRLTLRTRCFQKKNLQGLDAPSVEYFVNSRLR
jgi:hypothetical protein